MGSDAKRPTVGSNQRRATGLGRLAVLALATTTLVGALFAPSALASKEVVDIFGAAGVLGGQLDELGAMAVNETGVGPADPGDIYVSDRDNLRVQRFDSDGDFISAWGADVALSW